MRLKIAIPENRVSKDVLDAALEATTRLNESLIEHGDVPLFDAVRHRIRWRPEPKGDEHFDHAGLVVARGWGDCDDQAPHAAASMRATGEDPGARAVVRRSGPKTWHAVVERSDGRIRDPSKETGMRPGVAPGVFGAHVGSLVSGSAAVGAYIALPRLAVRPVRNPVSSDIEAWQARADLPWHWSPGESPTDIAMASLHASPVAAQSIVGALEGACELAEESGFVSGDTIACGEAMAWVCGGADWEDVADEFGEDVADFAFEEVDGLFRKIGRGLKKIAKKGDKILTSKPGKALSFLPAGRALMIARGATKGLSTKGGVTRKARGFGSGAFGGAADKLANPVTKGAASMFGMSSMTRAAEKASRTAQRTLEPGKKIKARDLAKLAQQGAALLPTGEIDLPKGIKLPNGVRLKQAGRLKLPKGVKVPRLKGLRNLKVSTVKRGRKKKRKFCFEQ